MPKYFGEAMSECSGSVCPRGGTKGDGAGQRRFWQEALYVPAAARGLRGSFPASPDHPPPALVLQMWHSHQIYFCKKFFFFKLLELFLAAGAFLPFPTTKLQRSRD